MSTMLSRIVAVSGEVSTTYPNTSDPDFSSAIHNFRNTTPVQVDTVQTNLQELRSSFTQSNIAIGRQLFRFTPGFVAMSYDPTTAAEQSGFRLGKFLKMCGMVETTPDGSSSSLRYKFTSSGFNNGFVNAGFNDSGSNSAVVYKMQGVYGTATLAGSAGQVITVDPTLTGVILSSSTTPTFDPNPQVVSPQISEALPASGNTAQTMKSEGLSITTSAGTAAGGAPNPALKFKSFSLDLGIDVQEDLDANAEDALGGLIIAGRNPTLNLTVEMNSEGAGSVENMYADLKSGYQQAISWTHGDAEGKWIAFSMTGKLQNVTQADDVGLRTLQLQYLLTNDTDENELSITFS